MFENLYDQIDVFYPIKRHWNIAFNAFTPTAPNFKTGKNSQTPL